MPLPSWAGFTLPIEFPFESVGGRLGQSAGGPVSADVGVARSRAASAPVTVDVTGRVRVVQASVTVDVLGRVCTAPIPVYAGVVVGGTTFPVEFPLEFRRGAVGPIPVIVGIARSRAGAVSVTAALLTGDPDAELLLWDAAETLAYGLPPALALDEQSIETTRPTFAPPGARVILPAGPRRARSRTIRISGTLAAPSSDEVDRLAREIRGAVLGRGVVTLERVAVPGRAIRMRAVRVSTDPHRGRFGGAVCTIVIDAEAADPFWYSVTPHAAVLSASTSGQSFTVANPGTVPGQPVAVVFAARNGTVISPTVVNTRNGLVVRFAGTLSAGQSVTLDARDRTAVFGDGSNALPWADPVWCERSFAFEPGENVLTYTDDPASSHAVDVTIIWTPAWW